jgi:hypothetical protein
MDDGLPDQAVCWEGPHAAFGRLPRGERRLGDAPDRIALKPAALDGTA